MKLRTKIIAGVIFGLGIFASPAAALAAEQVPHTFGVKDVQCQSDANQPHCPGSH